MKVRELLATALVPGGEELRLFRRDRDYMIVLDRNELMNSRMSGSEEQLATLTIARLKNRTNPRLLIGGYGMGFTLRAALAARRQVRVTVAELVPEIIEWARGPMAELTAGCLDDPRVRVVERDVAEVIAHAEGVAVLFHLDLQVQEGLAGHVGRHQTGTGDRTCPDRTAGATSCPRSRFGESRSSDRH